MDPSLKWSMSTDGRLDGWMDRWLGLRSHKASAERLIEDRQAFGTLPVMLQQSWNSDHESAAVNAAPISDHLINGQKLDSTNMPSIV